VALLQYPALLIRVYLGGTPIMWPNMSTRWALRLGVRPFALSFGPPQPYTSWLGLPGRRSALRLVFGLYASSLGSVLLVGLVVGAHREVVRQSVWLFDRPCGCSAVRMVVGFAMWSCGPPCRRCASRAVVEPRGRRWAVRVLVAPFASLGDPRRVPGMPRRVGVGRSGRQWGGGKKEGRKRATTKVMARFRDAPAGPPISWVPPCVSPPYPLVEQDCTGPHPSGEGRGGYGWMARVGSDGR